MSEQDDFLRELTELSRRYGIWIGGCGCCGSPFLHDEAQADDVYIADDGDLKRQSEAERQEATRQDALVYAALDEQAKAEEWAEQRRRWDEEQAGDRQ